MGMQRKNLPLIMTSSSLFHTAQVMVPLSHKAQVCHFLPFLECDILFLPYFFELFTSAFVHFRKWGTSCP